VGAALMRRLEREPVGEIVTATSREVDLRRQGETERFVAQTRPDVMLLAATKVGGIEANRSAQGEFLYDNLMIGANMLEARDEPRCPRPWSSVPHESTHARPPSRSARKRF
jgi:GDP-L-fucose synthase